MSPSKPPTKSKELPNEVRMVIAFVLMGLILVATPWVYKRLGLTPAQPAAPVKSAVQTQHTDAVKSAVTAQAETPDAAADASASGTVPTTAQAAAETEWNIDTKLYHVVFSNRGGVVRSWTLKNIKDNDGKPLELVNKKGDEKAGFPFTYEFRGQQPTSDLNKALWVAHPNGDGTAIEYEFSDGRTTAKKTFAFQSDGYMVQFADEVKLGSSGLPHLVQWRGGFGDMAVNSANTHQQTVYFDADKKKLNAEAAK